METKDIKIGDRVSVGGVGWGERGEVVWFDESVIAMKDGAIQFEVDKAGIDWVYKLG
jgi:hypothetical protein